MRHLLFSLGLAVPMLAAAIPAASGQPAPWKPASTVEYIVPSGAGAALDLAARKLVHLLQQEGVAENIVVTNKPGGANAIALGALQKHPGDGNYLSTLTTSIVNHNILGALKVPYSDFPPVAMLFDEALVVAVRSDSPLKNGRDLVERLKQDPKALSIAIATSLGNHIHLGIAKPLQAGGVDVGGIVVVPYRSSAESMNALLGGHVDVVSATTPNMVAHLQAGTIRLLAVAAPERLEGIFADVPTWREQGIDAIQRSSQGVIAPPGATPEQIAYWSEAIRKVTSKPEWKEFLKTNQWKENFQTPDQARASMDREFQEAQRALAALGMTGQ